MSHCRIACVCASASIFRAGIFSALIISLCESTKYDDSLPSIHTNGREMIFFFSNIIASFDPLLGIISIHGCPSPWWNNSHVTLLCNEVRRRSRHCQISVIIFYYHSSFSFLSKVTIEREIRSQGPAAYTLQGIHAKWVYVWSKNHSWKFIVIVSGSSASDSREFYNFYVSFVFSVIDALGYSLHFSPGLRSSDTYWNGFSSFFIVSHGSQNGHAN